MKKLPSVSVCVVASLVLATFLGDLPFATSAFCPVGCAEGCKSHNRWCAGGKHWRYGRNIVPPSGAGEWGAGGWCSQVPDLGDPVEVDTVSWSRFPTCVSDCVGINPSTETFMKVSESEASDTGNFNTRCVRTE